jgi:AcrR family transcriptional regulator
LGSFVRYWTVTRTCLENRMAKTEDRRVRRTRRALTKAFNRLILSRRKVSVSDIVDEADVGRSTFYEHFTGADDLHMQALSRPMAILADALASDGDHEELPQLLDHFWENRQRARETLAGPKRELVNRLLTEMVEQRLASDGVEYALPLPLAALQLAEGGLAPVRGWLMAQASIPSAALARSISRSASALRQALRVEPD